MSLLNESSNLQNGLEMTSIDEVSVYATTKPALLQKQIDSNRSNPLVVINEDKLIIPSIKTAQLPNDLLSVAEIVNNIKNKTLVRMQLLNWECNKNLRDGIPRTEYLVQLTAIANSTLTSTQQNSYRIKSSKGYLHRQLDSLKSPW